MAQKFNIQDSSQINLSSNGKIMQDEELLSKYSLSNLSTIDLNIKLIGGKTHGRIANAGKVKQQTPYVITKIFFFI